MGIAAIYNDSTKADPGKRIPYRALYTGHLTTEGTITAGNVNTITWNDDFLLAAQWQDSTTSSSVRGTNICAIEKITLSDKTTSLTSGEYLFEEKQGLNGKTKCTH